jgi:Acetyltransferase (GNAT) domain
MDVIKAERFGSDTRRSLRAAQRRAASAGLTIDCGSSPDLVADFYESYLRWVDRRARARGIPVRLARRRALRAKPRRKFDVVASGMGSGCRIRIARLGGQPVAANITLVSNRTAVYWRGYDDRAVASRLHAAELLHLRAIEEACKAGCEDYEMGEVGWRRVVGALQREAGRAATSSGGVPPGAPAADPGRVRGRRRSEAARWRLDTPPRAAFMTGSD